MLGKISDRNLGLLGIALGFVGVILSIYFYLASIAERRPIFLLDDTSRAVLASKDEMPQGAINITRSDGKPVVGDINIAKFYFWNEGSLAIKAEDILRSIRLRVENGEILSYKINKVSRDVVGARLAGGENNSVVILIDILERSDGFAGQIVYEGPRNAKVLLDGVIQGVGEIDFCSCIVPKKPWYIVSTMIAYLVMMFMVSRETYKTWRSEPSTSRSRLALLVVILIVMFGMLVDGLRRLHNFSEISADPPASIINAPKYP